MGVSGHAQSQYVEAGLKAGMDRFESKPLYAETLQEILVQANIFIWTINSTELNYSVFTLIIYDQFYHNFSVVFIAMKDY